ncbi:MAG: diguanylate cyclase [Gudongella sp.]|nr:diguanylate cyclase [Gudongella sp.]
MDLISNFTINIYSMFILIIIYTQSSKYADRDYLHNKLFIKLIRVTFFMLIFDIIGRFDGNPGTINSILNQSGNYLLFLLAPIIPSYWLGYVDYQIYQNETRTRKLFYPLLIINAFNFIMLNLSQIYGWYYYIDSANLYHRGSLYWVASSIPFLFIIYTSIFIFINRKKIQKKYFLSLLFFSIPPLVGTALQIVFYGISLVLNGMVLSILIVQFNIHNESVFIDYLTGVNNRKKLDDYLKEKIQTATDRRSFSAIMIDINGFKSINDRFGHDIGDKALQAIAKLLTSSIRSNDFIGRFGGDEFCVVLGVSDERRLLDVVNRIKNNIKKYNQMEDQPYTLGLSMGYAVYDYKSNMTVEEFQKHIDSLMYKNKEKRNGILIESKLNS